MEDGEEVLRLVEAARGAGRSLEAELLARVGKKFGHICMMDSVIECKHPFGLPLSALEGIED